MNETPEDSMSQLGGTADAELRAQILRYSLENTHPLRATGTQPGA
jgi:hypothetical protein